MRVLELQMHNFMPFKGTQTIRFPCQGEQNVANTLETGTCALCSGVLTQSQCDKLTLVASPATEETSTMQLANQLSTWVAQRQRLGAFRQSRTGEDLRDAERELNKASLELTRFSNREKELQAEIPGIDVDELSRTRAHRDRLQREIAVQEASKATKDATVVRLQREIDRLSIMAGSWQAPAVLRVRPRFCRACMSALIAALNGCARS